MSNKMKLFLLGCAPSIFGFIVSNLIFTLGLNGSGIFIYGAVFLACWYYVGYKYHKLSNYLNSIVLVHIMGLFCLLIQYLITSSNSFIISSLSFPLNLFSRLVVLYYLPMKTLIGPFTISSGLFNMYLYSFILMIILFSIGFRNGSKETR